MPAEDGQVQVRPVPHLSLWSIGQGFEGTASDWTEYVVWLVGFISLVFFIWSKNVQALPECDAPEWLLGPDDSEEVDTAEDDGGAPTSGAPQDDSKED
mmetsp:Transcript_116540/g.260660  ORF Transcript_116540/g.260660 Transcript_116540/m.260660 type:complete len:98 (+) Transcript_116540:131-424(+)